MTNEQTPLDRRTPLERLLGDTEPVRRALYPIVVAVVALLVAYGRLSAEVVPLWLALAVAVLGIGGTEAARRVAYAPATVAEYGRGWLAALEDERVRVAELVDDEPGEHAVDRDRRGEPTEALPAQELPTGLIRAPSRAMRCREVDAGHRCYLPRDHKGPHHMTTA